MAVFGFKKKKVEEPVAPAPAAAPVPPVYPGYGAVPIPSSGTWAGPGGTVVPVPQPEAAPAGPAQHTIYAFRRMVAVTVCPYCDGENNTAWANCCICGAEIRRGGIWR